MNTEQIVSTEGVEKPTKYCSSGDWQGKQVQVVGDTQCTGHRLEPVDHYGEPTEYLMCSECLGIAVKPEEDR